MARPPNRLPSREFPENPKTDYEIPAEPPSRAIMRVWAKRIERGEAAAIPVRLSGASFVLIRRGNKRVLRIPLS